MLCDQLRALKDAKQLTTQQIADKSGVPASTVSRILSGQTDSPSFQTVCDIVKAMDGSVDELVGIRPKQPPEDENTRIFNQIINDKNRWLRRLFIVCCVLVPFLLVVLTIDLLNPNFGYVRY